jgi:hypothetical protein
MLGGKPTFRTIGYDLDGARQQPGVRRILGMEPTGIEPVTSCLQSARSRAQVQV